MKLKITHNLKAKAGGRFVSMAFCIPGSSPIILPGVGFPAMLLNVECFIQRIMARRGGRQNGFFSKKII